MLPQPPFTTGLTKELRKYNTLIVDDEPRVLNRLEAQLSSAGFSVLRAPSGEEALEILDQQEIHVALCDQKMRPGMTGTEFLCEARKRKPHLVGIILSAFSEPKYLLSAINDARVLYYLLKPWDKAELIASVTRAIQIYHTRLMEELQLEALPLTQTKLAETLFKSTSYGSTLQEAAQALAVISDVTNQLSATIKKRFRDNN